MKAICNKKCMRNTRKQTKHYCENSTLHGLRYIISDNYLKSLMWLIMFILSILFCVYLIFLQIERYRNNRVSTSVSTTTYPVWKVPFPSVTICNYNIVSKSQLKILQEKITPFITANESLEYTQHLYGLILNQLYGPVDWKKISFITKRFELLGYDTEKLMKELAQPCSSLLEECYWKGNKTNCEDIFSMIKTESGFCCSFNYRGTRKNSSASDRQRKVQGVGPNFGLEVYLNIDEEDYVSSLKSGFGLDIKIHGSYNYPDSSYRTSTISTGNKFIFEIEPQVTEAKDDIRDLTEDQRECRFEDEAKMLWARRYTFTTCMSECKLRAIHKFCRCTPYYYPVENVSRYCSLMDLNCLQRYDDIFNIVQVEISDGDDNTTSAKKIHCNCVSNCNQIIYLYQVDKQKSVQRVARNETVNKTVLTIFFGRIGCTKYLKHIHLTWDTILASVGGIFGLCLGGSILSLLELLYYILFGNFNEKLTQKQVVPFQKARKQRTNDIKFIRMPPMQYLP